MGHLGLEQIKGLSDSCQSKTGEQVQADFCWENWSYSYNEEMIFDTYQRMRAYGTSWAGPSLLACTNKIANCNINLFSRTVYVGFVFIVQ